MNAAMERLRRVQSNGKPLIGTVIGMDWNTNPERLVIDYDGCQKPLATTGEF